MDLSCLNFLIASARFMPPMAAVNVCAANAAASTSFLDKYGGGSSRRRW